MVLMPDIDHCWWQITGFQAGGLLLRRKIWALPVSISLVLVSSASACRGKPASPPSPGSAAKQELKAIVSTPGPNEVTISPEEFDRTTILKVGQVFRVKPPLDAARWQVSYDDKVITSLFTADRMAAPGAQGWLFRVVAEGQTEVTFVSVPRSDAGPPMAARISLTVRGVK